MKTLPSWFRTLERAGFLLGVSAALAAPPPPPPGGGGSTLPPAPPIGRLYFQDNVVLIGPGFVKPEAEQGTIYVTLPQVSPDPVSPQTPAVREQTLRRTVDTVNRVKDQLEAATGEIPRGLLSPVSCLGELDGLPRTAGRGIFDDPAFLHEEVGGGDEAAPDRTDEARSGAAAVRVAPGAPLPTPATRRKPGAWVTPSYWQLPIR